MECEGKIAEVYVDLKTRQVVQIVSNENPSTFMCRRCAVFCCKLGGPKLSKIDIERLKCSAHGTEEFLDSAKVEMKNGPDGSCIFLSFESSSNLYECEVYSYRPALCRLYPFHFEKMAPRNYLVKLIPCCNGINAKDGHVVDEKFLTKIANEVLFELIDGGLV